MIVQNKGQLIGKRSKSQHGDVISSRAAMHQQQRIPLPDYFRKK
jgi:hypothetical protein